MPTYDYTGDGDGTIKGDFFRKSVLMLRKMKVTDIVASDTTLMTNGVIAAGDIIQMIDIPAGFVLNSFFVKTVTPEGAALKADFGVAGGDEAIDNYDLNQAAGTITLTGVADDWGRDNLMGYAFSTADTLDMNFVSETDAGEWHVYIGGFFLD